MKRNALFIFLIIIGAVAIFGGVVLFRKFLLAPTYSTVAVMRGNMVEEVSATGKVEGEDKVDLLFKTPKKIVKINAKVGDVVVAGQVLAVEDTKELDSQIKEMEAGIKIQRARLNQLNAGSSKEEINVTNSSVSSATTNVANAEESLKNARQGTVDSLKSAFTTADDILRNKVDQMFTNPQGSTPKLVFYSASDFELGNTLEFMRVSLETDFKVWSNESSAVSITSGDLLKEISDSKKRLEKIKEFLNKFSVLINNPVNKPTAVAQTTWDGWRSDISNSKISVNTNLSALTSAEVGIINGESSVKIANDALKTANSQLIFQKAPTRQTDSAVYEAQIGQAIAAKDKVESQRQDYMITAPFAGMVTEVNGKVGEIADPTKTVIALLSSGGLKIKLNVVENNVVKVKIGQNVRITFDSMPEKEFIGKVTAIDPAETEINGTTYYQTTVVLNEKEDFIRSGMTANVWVETKIAEGALYIPVSAIEKRGGESFVKILEGSTAVEKTVKTGIINDDGMIEIVSGLSEGQKVIVETKK